MGYPSRRPRNETGGVFLSWSARLSATTDVLARLGVGLRRIASGLVLLLGLTLCGCGRSLAPADLVIVNGPEPESLDPHLVTGQADGRIAMALFEGLTRYEPVEARPVPGLADHWEISPDGRVYTFHIRTNAAWSTGEPILAADFAWSWKRGMDPATASEYAGVFFYIQNAESYATGALKDFGRVGVHALDARTLRVELGGPTAFFLDLLAYHPFAVLPRQLIEARGDRWLHARPFVSSGAYTLDFWRLNDRVRLLRNNFYYDAANTRSAVVDFLPCGSPGTALNLYTTGAADIVWDKDLVATELLDSLIKRPDFHTYDSLGTMFLRFNVTRRPFSDPRVRKAFLMAVDKEALVTRITRGHEKIARVMTPPKVANGAIPYRPPAGLDYNPAKARELLAAAGYPAGGGFPRIVYTYNTQEIQKKIAVELQQMWSSALGVQVSLQPLEWKTYFRAQSMLDYDIIRSSWIGDYNDPNTFLDLFMSDNPNNRTGWRNPAYDAALRAANTEVDPERRQEFLARAERILVEEDVPVGPVFFYVGMEQFDPRRVEGVYGNPRSEHPIRAIGRRAGAVSAGRTVGGGL